MHPTLRDALYVIAALLSGFLVADTTRRLVDYDRELRNLNRPKTLNAEEWSANALAYMNPDDDYYTTFDRPQFFSIEDA